MAVVFWIHSTRLLLLSYAALSTNSLSIQKPTLNRSEFTLKPNASTMPEISSLNGANGVGMMYSRGAGSSRRDNDTLNVHNKLRRDVNPPAANMPKLRWGYDLARLAELWSRHCIMEHGLPLTLDPLAYSGQIRQNIWSGGRNGTIEDALLSWLKEGNDYNFKTRACYRSNGCRNYLTMISVSVYKVGCGLSHCNDDVIVVCYYGARDYISHQSPYTAGKPCSRCSTFEWCDGGLCRSSGNERKDDAVGTNYNKIDRESNEGTLNAVSLADGPHLERQRRHTTEEAQGTCVTINLPLWIFVGILIGVVVIGFLIGIIYMLAHICKDMCTGCSNSNASDGCSLGCCTSREGSSRCCTGSDGSEMSETRGGSLCCVGVCRLKCCKKGSVRPKEDDEGTSTTGSEEEQTRQDSEGSDSPDRNHSDSDPSLVNDVDHRENSTNTDPEPTTTDRSTCIEHNLLETNDAGTSVDLNCIDAAVQTDDIKSKKGAEKKKGESEGEEDDRENKNQENNISDVNSKHTDSDDSDSGHRDHSDRDHSGHSETVKVEQNDPTDSSQGVCLVHNCTTCDMHTRDMRQVDELRKKNIRKLIKASKNKNLPPGTYII